MPGPLGAGGSGLATSPAFGTMPELPFGTGIGLGASPGAGSAFSGSQAGGINFETTAEITSANDLSATNPNEYLVGLLLRGGPNSAGALQILYDTINSAILPVGALPSVDVTGAKGLSPFVFYPLNMKFAGTKAIAAGVQTFVGGLAGVRAIFSNQPNPAPGAISNWNQLRAVAVTGNESGTSGTAKTYTMPGGVPIAPIAISAMCANQSGSVTGAAWASIKLPTVQPFGAYSVLCEPPDSSPRAPRRYPIPAIGPATSYSLTHLCESLGGTTDVEIMGVLWLPPA